MTPLDRIQWGLWFLALACIIAVCVTLARAGGTPTTAHDVMLIQSAQDWSASPYNATVFSCTRSAGAPPCAVGGNTAQVIADMMTAGFRCDPALGQATLGYGLACLR